MPFPTRLLRLGSLCLPFVSNTLVAAYTGELFSPLIQSKVLNIANAHAPTTYPEYTYSNNGSWIYFPADTWTTGFFPATLYALYERSLMCSGSSSSAADEVWLNLGRSWSTAEIPLETTNNLGHDVGFISFPFVQELKVNPNNVTAQVAVKNFANDLAARFSPIVGCTRSWNSTDPDDFVVIIDNMMNLQVFFDNYALTGNTDYIEMAKSHANKTMINHVRADGSSFHVVDYNATTGAVIDRRTSQGYADNSTWSRGQAWGIYGFANMFNHTSDANYLVTSRRMATYFINNIPANGIVPWDFNAPLVPPRPADSSAALIAANGMLLLSQMETSVSNQTGAQFWINSAIQIIANTTNLAWKPSWQSLLSNGTVNNRASPPNNLTGIVYGDYYFIEAGNTLFEMGLAQC